MARSLDAILVIDVESTFREESPPLGQSSEFIEVGLCSINLKTLPRTEKRSILVRPVKSKLSEFCTELTTLTPEMFRDASSLTHAANTLRKEFDSKNRLWANWGDYDRKQFERACYEQDVNSPIGSIHLSVKSLFAAAVGTAHELALDRACRRPGIKMEGTHHRGDDDAWNIAGILCRLLESMRNSEGKPAALADTN